MVSEKMEIFIMNPLTHTRHGYKFIFIYIQLTYAACIYKRIIIYDNLALQMLAKAISFETSSNPHITIVYVNIPQLHSPLICVVYIENVPAQNT